MDIKNHDYANCKVEKCWECQHWKVEINNPRAFVRSDWTLFVDGGKKPNGTKFLGHAGRVFIIKPSDGRSEVITNNLWCAGTVPEFFRKQLPINCTIECGDYKDLK